MTVPLVSLIMFTSFFPCENKTKKRQIGYVCLSILYYFCISLFLNSLLPVLNRRLAASETDSTEGPTQGGRILVVQTSADVPSQYIPVMNCIFAAQKLNILVDACVLRPVDSPFLRQAAHISGGTYFTPSQEEEKQIAHCLLCMFGADRPVREHFGPTVSPTVDNKASCFCHQKPVDRGLVCCVCLSVFCTFRPVCQTCGTKFPLPVPISAARPS
eukprot:Rmarinus@m.28124